MAPFCAGCGNSMTADDKFCRVCGRAVRRFRRDASNQRATGSGSAIFRCRRFVRVEGGCREMAWPSLGWFSVISERCQCC
jgi:predicted amidophosphoribosyltransferase